MNQQTNNSLQLTNQTTSDHLKNKTKRIVFDENRDYIDKIKYLHEEKAEFM